MKKPMDAYLPKKTELRPVQGNVSVNTFAAVDAYRQSKELTWSELIEALFQRLLDESKNKGKAC